MFVPLSLGDGKAVAFAPLEYFVAVGSYAAAAECVIDHAAGVAVRLGDFAGFDQLDANRQGVGGAKLFGV